MARKLQQAPNRSKEFSPRNSESRLNNQNCRAHCNVFDCHVSDTRGAQIEPVLHEDEMPFAKPAISGFGNLCCVRVPSPGASRRTYDAQRISQGSKVLR